MAPVVVAAVDAVESDWAGGGGGGPADAGIVLAADLVDIVERAVVVGLLVMARVLDRVVAVVGGVVVLARVAVCVGEGMTSYE